MWKITPCHLRMIICILFMFVTLWGVLNTLNFPKFSNHIFEDKLIFKWKPIHNFLYSFYISVLIFTLNVNLPLGFVFISTWLKYILHTMTHTHLKYMFNEFLTHVYTCVTTITTKILYISSAPRRFCAHFQYLAPSILVPRQLLTWDGYQPIIEKFSGGYSFLARADSRKCCCKTGLPDDSRDDGIPNNRGMMAALNHLKRDGGSYCNEQQNLNTKCP